MLKVLHGPKQLLKPLLEPREWKEHVFDQNEQYLNSEQVELAKTERLQEVGERWFVRAEGCSVVGRALCEVWMDLIAFYLWTLLKVEAIEMSDYSLFIFKHCDKVMPV